jgi:hypothetical protein
MIFAIRRHVQHENKSRRRLASSPVDMSNHVSKPEHTRALTTATFRVLLLSAYIQARRLSRALNWVLSIGDRVTEIRSNR